jgi:hypothetical protein
MSRSFYSLPRHALTVGTLVLSCLSKATSTSLTISAFVDVLSFRSSIANPDPFKGVDDKKDQRVQKDTPKPYCNG